MPQKGMRSLFFPQARSSPSQTPQPSFTSSPRLTFSPSSSRSFANEVMDKTLERAQPMFMKWNPTDSTTSLFYHSRNEAKAFIKNVNNLQRAMQFLVAENPSSQKLATAQNLMQIAMQRIQKELYHILSMHRAHLDPESVSTRSSGSATMSNFSDSDFEENQESNIVEVEDISVKSPWGSMSDMKLIAECMISNGYATECMKVYRVMRKSIIDEGIYKLGVEKLSPSQIQKMDYEVLELKIKNWLNAVNLAVKTLFNGEKIICDNVFAANDSIKDSIFSEISTEGGVILFSFPKNVVKNSKKSKKSREKVFRVLDMYSTMKNLWPEIESIFALQSNYTVKTQAISSLTKMAEFVRENITDFEAGILKNSSKSVVSGGGINPLTIDVSNYLALLSDYSSVLGDIIADMAPPIKSLLPEYLFGMSDSLDTRESVISMRLEWLILVLLCKLDSKAKSYKDVSLAYLFLANNLQYVVVKVKMSNLKNLLGDEWLSKQERKVKQFSSTYVKLGWSHVINTIPEDPTAVKTVGEVKDCFKKFNGLFEQVYHKQSVCVVADRKLRDEIKLGIARILIPVYREFYDKHKLVLSKERNVVRYSPEDIGNYLSDLFFEVVRSNSSASSSSSRSWSHPRLSRQLTG